MLLQPEIHRPKHWRKVCFSIRVFSNVKGCNGILCCLGYTILQQEGILQFPENTQPQTTVIEHVLSVLSSVQQQLLHYMEGSDMEGPNIRATAISTNICARLRNLTDVNYPSLPSMDEPNGYLSKGHLIPTPLSQRLPDATMHTVNNTDLYSYDMAEGKLRTTSTMLSNSSSTMLSNSSSTMLSNISSTMLSNISSTMLSNRLSTMPPNSSSTIPSNSSSTMPSNSSSTMPSNGSSREAAPVYQKTISAFKGSDKRDEHQSNTSNAGLILEGQECAICGLDLSVLQCTECSGKAVCEGCDMLWHSHHKRRHHTRHLVDTADLVKARKNPSDDGTKRASPLSEYQGLPSVYSKQSILLELEEERAKLMKARLNVDTHWQMKSMGSSHKEVARHKIQFDEEDDEIHQKYSHNKQYMQRRQEETDVRFAELDAICKKKSMKCSETGNGDVRYPPSNNYVLDQYGPIQPGYAPTGAKYNQTQSAPSNDGEMRNVWCCTKCTFVNERSATFCEVCDAEWSYNDKQSKHNDEADYEFVQHGSVYLEADLATLGSEWCCVTCTFVNPGTATVCEICDAKRKNKDKDPYVYNSEFVSQNEPSIGTSNKEWSCTRCSSVNQSSRSVCDICHTRRHEWRSDAAMYESNVKPEFVQDESAHFKPAAGGREKKWCCSACTYLNKTNLTICGLCSTGRAQDEPRNLKHFI